MKEQRTGLKGKNLSVYDKYSVLINKWPRLRCDMRDFDF